MFAPIRSIRDSITDVRRAAEDDMTRWVDENGVDRHAVAVGMIVERLLQVLRRQREMRKCIAKREAERASIEEKGMGSDDGRAKAYPVVPGSHALLT